MDFQPGFTKHGGCGDRRADLFEVKNEFITAENVVSILDKYDVPEDLELVTVDEVIADYYILEALLKSGRYHPRVVAVDFNPDFDLSEAKVVHRDDAGEWDGTKYTTTSLLAFALNVMRPLGYSFVYSLEMGAHAFFVRTDLLHCALIEADLCVLSRK